MEIVQRKPVLDGSDDRLNLFFIGVGSTSSRLHYQTNMLVTKGKDHVLIDFGTQGPRALAEVAGLEVSDIRVTLPTHSHADHIGGYEEMAIMGRYGAAQGAAGCRPKMIITETYQQILWDHSLRGGLEYNEALAGEGGESSEVPGSMRKLCFHDYFEPIRPLWLQMQPREKFSVDVGSLHLELFRTKHVPQQSSTWENSFWSCGLCIDERVFYSGDTRFDPELIKEYQQCEIFFHDCQLLPGAVHASYDELLTLPEQIRRRTILMHYGDNWEDFPVEEDGFFGFAQQGVQYIL